MVSMVRYLYNHWKVPCLSMAAIPHCKLMAVTGVHVSTMFVYLNTRRVVGLPNKSTLLVVGLSNSMPLGRFSIEDIVLLSSDEEVDT